MRAAADASTIGRMKDDWSAAFAFIAIMIFLKITLGLIIFVYMPLREAASLYTIIHLSAIFGIIPLLALLGGGGLFWWRVVRMRMRRHEFLQMEWKLEEQEPSH